MNYIWSGLGGFVIGGIIGWLIGRRNKKKKVEMYSDSGLQDMTEYEEEEEDSDEDMCQFHDIGLENQYIIEDDLNEMDDYLAETESPEEDEADDDLPEYSVAHGYFTDQDEYYTAKHEYEKYVLEYDSATGSFFNKANGDDLTNDLAHSGIDISAMLERLDSDDRVYWRVDGSAADYEIMIGEE